jgi:hypothetical protein
VVAKGFALLHGAEFPVAPGQADGVDNAKAAVQGCCPLAGIRRRDGSHGRGRLWLNGVVPLEPAGDGRFYLRDEPASPEWVGFSDIVNGSAMRMRLSGADLARV